VQGSKIDQRMAASGQKQTSRRPWAMSAIAPIADIARRPRHVRYVPKADIGRDSQPMIFVIFSTVPSLGRQLVACVPVALRLTWPFARRAPSLAPFRRARSPRV
jgi:hypothetical protein